MARTINYGSKEKEDIDNINEEKDIYDEDGIQKLRDEGQISDWEAGFMQGAAGGGEGAKCRNCGKIFTSDDKIVERKKDDKRYIFCSDKCGQQYFDKQERECEETFKGYKQ